MIKKTLFIGQFVAFTIWIYYLSSIPNPLEFLQTYNVWDKAEHLFGYFCYTLSALLAFSEIFSSKTKRFILTCTFIYIAIFSASDEIHQYFVPGHLVILTIELNHYPTMSISSDLSSIALANDYSTYSPVQHFLI